MKYNVMALLDDLLSRSALPDSPAPVPVHPGVPPTIGPEHLPMDWRIEWEERAAIMEYDGGLSREGAEAKALADILRQMAEVGAFPLRRAG